MKTPPLVSDIQFLRAPEADRRTGLYGWVDIVLTGVRVTGIAVRRTSKGKLTLSFPERRDGKGRPHAIAHPINARSRRALEDEIFAVLRERGAVR